MNPLDALSLIDFYKVGHVSQYPADTEQVWSNWTARSTRVPGQSSVVFFGLQAFIKEILQERWNEFFRAPLSDIVHDYRVLIGATLGIAEPRTDHIEYLHRLGYLPLDIYALPEGESVPIGVPMLVITNTDRRAYWLPNYLETVLSAHLWKPITSATTAQRFRKLFLDHARRFGERDLSFVNWQGHDFSYRGMSGEQDAVMSGMAHLLSFNGTDTVPAILAARRYYRASLNCGGSVPATEHSVMCAGTAEGEFETFERLITRTYPSGIVSIVSDTWDLWRVLTDYVPRLRETILARDGKVVIRPDSGDPVKIVIGDPAGGNDNARAGALRLLADAMGTDGRGHINKAGIIYGDGISLERADAILSGAARMGLSPFNVVFGIGSYTYELVTRDTYNQAMKATAVRRSGTVVDIFKDPVTDDFSKKSLRGIPAVYGGFTDYFVKDSRRPVDLDGCAFRKVFSNGVLLLEHTFDEIRKRVRR